MGRQAGVVLYVLALVAVVVGVDVLFFRHRFLERLMVNVGIVLARSAFESSRARSRMDAMFASAWLMVGSLLPERPFDRRCRKSYFSLKLDRLARP
jgi:hypothetical protein